MKPRFARVSAIQIRRSVKQKPVQAARHQTTAGNLRICLDGIVRYIIYLMKHKYEYDPAACLVGTAGSLSLLKKKAIL
jgi:hypothetical protein